MSDVKSLIKKHILLIFGMLFLGLLIPLMPGALIGVPKLDNIRFILLAFFPVLCFSYALLSKAKIVIPITASDFAWLTFTGLGFLSFYWARNGSLAWNASFGWLSLILWMLLFRTIALKEKSDKYLSILLLIFFLALMLHLILAFSTGLLKEPNYWNIFFGYDSNRNFTLAYFLTLYPFFLFYPFKNNTKTKLLQILCAVFLVYILIQGNARGVIVAFLFVALFYSKVVLAKKYFQNLFWFTGVAVICMITFFSYNLNLLSDIPVFKEFLAVTESNRIYMIYSSVCLFLENPILGIGLGNWHIEAYKYNLDKNVTFGHPWLIQYYRNHNLFSQHLAELGAIGFMSFLTPIGIVLWQGWIKCKSLTPLQKAAYASLLVYLATSCFYHTTSFSEYRFSGMHLLAFCSLGILTKGYRPILILPKLLKILLLVLSLFCFAWFVYSNYAYDKYVLATNLAEEKPLLAIQELEELHNSYFKTIHTYNILLSFDLAKLYERQELYDKAERYYQTALKEAPYNREVLLNYAQFLYHLKKEPKKAKIYAERFYRIQTDYIQIGLLLAEIAIDEKKYEDATKYLNDINLGYSKEEGLRLKERIKQEQNKQ